MPTPWKRAPEELHKSYVSNTEAFYKAAGRHLAPELDRFMEKCAVALFARSGAVTQGNVDSLNQIYSKDRPQPKWLLWELTGAVCDSGDFLPPLFFWDLAEKDGGRGTDDSRMFIRLFTNIMLYLAAVDDDVTLSEAEFITECTDKLSAVCDSAKVKKSQPALNAADFVTSSVPAFRDKQKSSKASAAAQADGAKAQPAQEAKPEEKPDFDSLMAKLDELVGLETVKKDVKSLVNLIKVRKLRSQFDLPSPDMSLHLVFMGNPGTGKTTVARLLAGLYAAIGVLSKGQLVEVDRSGLVAGYVGQTAIKTQEVLKSALGGVLFIDEAYSLANGGENDFGREAIEILLKNMEDNREDLVVIVAGYDKPMEKFISANPGLESRFNKYFYFPDYTGDELLSIFENMCEKNGYTLTEDAKSYAKEFFHSVYENRDENFGNGRDVRNRFEDMVGRQANRVAALPSPQKEDLMTVLREDLEIK
jgi:hypothetical protein